MCMYCERRTDIKFGWEQPKLPYHSNNLNEGRLNGNVLENEKWDGVINLWRKTHRLACGMKAPFPTFFLH